MQAPACRTGERQTLCVKHAGRDIAGDGKREASVAIDSVRYHSNADCELVIVVDEMMHATACDSKSFARRAWRSHMLWAVHGGTHDGTDIEAPVVRDSVRHRLNADTERVIVVVKMMHGTDRDSKSFACHAHA